MNAILAVDERENQVQAFDIYTACDDVQHVYEPMESIETCWLSQEVGRIRGYRFPESLHKGKREAPTATTLEQL